jgi:hypothetical protein
MPKPCSSSDHHRRCPHKPANHYQFTRPQHHHQRRCCRDFLCAQAPSRLSLPWAQITQATGVDLYPCSDRTHHRSAQPLPASPSLCFRHGVAATPFVPRPPLLVLCLHHRNTHNHRRRALRPAVVMPSPSTAALPAPLIPAAICPSPSHSSSLPRTHASVDAPLAIAALCRAVNHRRPPRIPWRFIFQAAAIRKLRPAMLSSAIQREKKKQIERRAEK